MMIEVALMANEIEIRFLARTLMLFCARAKQHYRPMELSAL
jgi:hypothetical protein